MSVRGIDLAPAIGGGSGAGFTTIGTVAEMKTLQGAEPLIVYCDETAGVYRYCADCDFDADDDLVIETGNGGTTRWELLQKMSRKIGDTGWIDSDNATISAHTSTIVRLTISSQAAIGLKGVRIPVPIGTYDIELTGAAGVKFIGFDDDTLVLKSRDTLWDFESEVPVSIAYWSGTAIVAAPQTEFHGIRDTIWHKWAHNFLGLQYVSGLAFTGSVQTDNNVDPGASETVYNLWSTSGVVQDEDIRATPGDGQWAQTLGTGLAAADAGVFPFFYFNGTFITTNAAMADRAPFIHAGANTPPRWNNGGTLTAAVTGDYIVYHYFANPMVGGWSIFGRPHNAKFTSLATALAARPTQLNWSNYAELKHIYTAIFRVNTGWANSHRCKLVSLSDYRTVAGTPVAAVAPTNHAGLSGLELAGAGVTWGHINDQAQTIAGLKTLDGGALIKGATSAVAAGYAGELKLMTARSESLTTSSPSWSVVGAGSLVDLTAGKWLLICRYDCNASATTDVNVYVALATEAADDAGGIITNETVNIQYFDAPLGTLSCVVDTGTAVSVYGKATAPVNGTLGIAFATGSIGWAFRMA